MNYFKKLCLFLLFVSIGGNSIVAQSDSTVIDSPVKNYRYMSMQKSLMQSTLFPGLGAYKIDNNKANLLIGGAAYTSLFASYMYHREAVSNFDDYSIETDLLQRENYYSDWTRQHKMSRTFAIAAATIWVADLVYTGIKNRKHANSISSSIESGEYNKRIVTEDKETKTQSPVVTTDQPKSKVGPFFQSVLFPGLGAYKITGNESYLLIGGVAYGTAFTSYLYYRKAVDSYDNYLDETDFDTREAYYSDWTHQHDMYKKFAIASASVWLADLLLVAILDYKTDETSVMRSIPVKTNVGMGYDPISKNPQLKLTFTF